MADTTVEDYEWDVYYQHQWVGNVYAPDRKAAIAEAKFQFEHESWDFSELTVARSKN